MKYLKTLFALGLLVGCDGESAQRGSGFGENCAKTADCTAPLVCINLVCGQPGGLSDAVQSDALVSDALVDDSAVAADALSTDATHLADGTPQDGGVPDMMTGPCQYPQAPETAAIGAVAPNLSWPTAIGPEDEEFPFSFDSYHCDRDFARYPILTLVVCSPWAMMSCGDRLGEILDFPTLDAAGVLVAHLQLTDDSMENLSTSAESRANLRTIGANSIPIALGADGIDDLWSALLTPLGLRSLPSVVVIRRHDMAVLAGPNHVFWRLPLEEMAADPDGVFELEEYPSE